ncbi:MAG: PKD domain-containing protein [Thermoplasmatales archaeon]|nr:PKD domain-containing protein [Thermoplasmatales archaeon]
MNGNERAVFLSIDVYPARYRKEDKIVEWCSEIEININYNLLINLETDDIYNFVIICEDAFANSLQNFVNHKSRISTKVLKLNDISSGRYFNRQGRDSAEQIKYFIKNAVENWNTYSVLLVGSNVPSREVHVRYENDNEIFVSDLYYADIYSGDGTFSSWDTNKNNVFAEINWGPTDDELDLYPDVHLARIPCIDSNELATIVNKIINYENSNAYSQEWFKHLIAVGGDSFTGNDVLEGEYANKYVINLMSDFTSTKVWVSEDNLATKGPLNNAINSGAGFIHFSGHGNTNIWATHPYNDEETWLPKPTGGYLSFDIELLRNGEKLPIVITGACSISKFNKDKSCFSYAWLKNPNGGGIASFGATGLGWSYVGKDVTKGLNEGIVIETFKAYKNGATSLGEMWTRPINSYIQTYRMKQVLDYKTVLEWECFGDPTLILRVPSLPPNKPDRPIGETSVKIKKEYTYQTSTTDPDGDKIYYIFDWGDGAITQVGPFESGATATAIHTWERSGNYIVRVRAKDEHGAVSEWSDSLPVRMQMSKTLKLLSRILKFFQDSLIKIHF